MLLDLALHDVVADSLWTEGLVPRHHDQQLLRLLPHSGVVVAQSVKQLVEHHGG